MQQQTARRGSLIPTTKHKPRAGIQYSSHAIQGPPGSGKTTFASTWPAVLFLATESGTQLLEAAEVPIPDWQTFLQALEQLEATDHPWRTICLDTVDGLHARCVEHVCRLKGWNHPGENARESYALIKMEWKKGIHKLAGLRNKQGQKLCPLFIIHTKEEKITKQEDNQAVDTGRVLVRSCLQPHAQSILHDAMDFIYSIHIDAERERWLVTQPYDLPKDKPEVRYQAKARGTPDRMLPVLIPLDFAALRAAFEQTFGTNGKEQD